MHAPRTYSTKYEMLASPSISDSSALHGQDGKTHLQGDAPEVLDLVIRRLVKSLLVDRIGALAGVGRRDIMRHGELEGRLARLRDLERAHHREDGTPPLDRTHGTGHVGAAVAHAVDMVENGDDSGRAKQEVAL